MRIMLPPATLPRSKRWAGVEDPRPADRSRNYTYDELDRLKTVSGAYTQNYSYNTIGNMTVKNTSNYTYDANHKHAVASLSTGESYTYDANGNMITRVEGGVTYTQTFDAENRLVSMTANGQTVTLLV